MGSARVITALLFVGALGSAIAIQTEISSKQASAMGDAKQIALGTLMYCNDYDDVLPYVRSTKPVMRVVRPYLRNDAVWQTHNPAGSIFGFNLSIGGVNANAITAPAATLMYYETKPWTDGTRIVAYCDGHVKRVNASEWRKVESTLHLKLPRVAKKPIG